MKTKTITLTDKQFLSILKTVYLGNWLANAYSIDTFKKDYESAEDFIFCQAPKFGFKKFVDHKKSDGQKYYPTRSFEEDTDVQKVIQEYDEETFWEELAERLGLRDFIKKYSKSQIKKMTRDEYFQKFTDCVDYYNLEFERYGIDRFIISPKSNKK